MPPTMYTYILKKWKLSSLHTIQIDFSNFDCPIIKVIFSQVAATQERDEKGICMSISHQEGNTHCIRMYKQVTDEFLKFLKTLFID
jgi:hypothetical protein